MRGDDGFFYCAQCLRFKEPEKHATLEVRRKVRDQARWPGRKVMRLSQNPTYTVAQAREQCDALVMRVRNGEDKGAGYMRFQVRGRFQLLITTFFDVQPPIVGGCGKERFRWYTLLVESLPV